MRTATALLAIVAEQHIAVRALHEAANLVRFLTSTGLLSRTSRYSSCAAQSPDGCTAP